MFSVLRVSGLAVVSLLGIGLAASNLPSAARAAPPPASGATPSAAASASAPVSAAPGKAAKQLDFATADAAAEALFKANQADDIAALRAIFGPSGDNLVVSGDAVADSAARKRFVEAYTTSHSLVPSGDGRMTLVIGPNAWPMPIPLEQVAGSWRFDTSLGAGQIVDRRIGRNELLTIRTLLAVVAAQKDYFDRLQRGSGTGAYAQRVLSTPGMQDGLYWEVAPGEVASPLGPLLEQVENEGYPGATASKGKPVPYQGYFYHMLKAQGPNAPGGAMDYVRNGSMTGGFAFVAWPAGYESSGIMTFLVDQDGVVFQKDLGRGTATIAAGMTRFDPDVTWTRIDLTD